MEPTYEPVYETDELFEGAMQELMYGKEPGEDHE